MESMPFWFIQHYELVVYYPSNYQKEITFGLQILA